MGEDGKSYFLKLNSKLPATQGTGRSKFNSNLSFNYNVKQLIIRI